jgi:predicted Mrr-cat superfamily restriction endonuclease
MKRAWAVKLGSGGRCAPFCEKHNIVGVGWQGADFKTVSHASKEMLWKHLQQTHPNQATGSIGQWTGVLYRFSREVQRHDYILYYDPNSKCVRVCSVEGDFRRRDFDLDAKDTEGQEVDIWFCRSVTTVATVPVLDLDGVLKGKILGPRGTCWELSDCYERVDAIVNGISIHVKQDPEIQKHYFELRDLVSQRAKSLNAEQWEQLVADYFVAQGAHIRGKIGGSMPAIDVEAYFDQGELGESKWRIQVKREAKPLAWDQIEYTLKIAGDFPVCFVSVNGFTDDALKKADAWEGNILILLEASHFFLFLLGDKLRPELRNKLAIPRVKSGTA